ncbi:MAG TPA: hypothetical protein VF897_01895, partial [Roseiflexaceae bacterium]
PPAPPALPGMATQVLCGLAVLALLALPALARSRRAGASAPETQVGVFAPQALGESVRGVARSATATDAFLAGWRGLLWASRTMWQALAVFEQRYYLAGLVIALIVVILLFIQ